MNRLSRYGPDAHPRERTSMQRMCRCNSYPPGLNGRHFTDDIFKCVFLNENVWIRTKIQLKFVPKGPISNNPSLVQIMAWRRPGDKSISEPVMVSLLTHMCFTRHQWVNICNCKRNIVCLVTWNRYDSPTSQSTYSRHDTWVMRLACFTFKARSVGNLQTPSSTWLEAHVGNTSNVD